MINVFLKHSGTSHIQMSTVIQSDLQGYNSSTSSAAIAQIFFGIALSQFVSYRRKCLL